MPEESELIAACKRGEHSAFELLYKKYASVMKMVAYRYVGDQDVAEDILHDSFIKIYERIGQLKDASHFGGWVRRIVVNEALDYLKQKKKLSQIMEESMQLIDNSESDSKDAYRNISMKDLMEALNTLPTGYRMIFNMHVIDGLPHKDIADSLSITEGTSKSQLARAKEFLKKQLSKKLNF